MAQKMLLIENNYIYAQMYRKRLPQKSFSLETVSDGADARRRMIAGGKGYDVIVTNLFSPPPDGLTLFVELMEKNLLPETFVILHSLTEKELETFLDEHCPDIIRGMIPDIVFINKAETKPQAVMAEVSKSVKTG